MSRLMQTRLAKLEGHKRAQEPVQRVPQSERDAAVRRSSPPANPPRLQAAWDNLAERRNAAVAAALRADA